MRNVQGAERKLAHVCSILHCTSHQIFTYRKNFLGHLRVIIWLFVAIRWKLEITQLWHRNGEEKVFFKHRRCSAWNTIWIFRNASAYAMRPKTREFIQFVNTHFEHWNEYLSHFHMNMSEITFKTFRNFCHVWSSIWSVWIASQKFPDRKLRKCTPFVKCDPGKLQNYAIHGLFSR